MSSEIIKAIASKALDGLQVRQAATAQNIANANSVDYQPLRVSFEEQLRLTVSEAGTANPADLAREIGALRPSLQWSADGPEHGVRIDYEIAQASETSARYAMLIGVLNRTLQIEQLAIKGG
ncbi:MAG: flagellar basal body rod protein FlgB [Pseudomonas sp.]|uniref:flagellar basal body rod protein FlgB n=1 Tax=Stenotrophomonas sp. TaxID=69392 RepID=UPI003D6D297D